MAEKQTIQVVTTELTPRGTVTDQAVITVLALCLTGRVLLDLFQDGVTVFNVISLIVFTLSSMVSIVKTVARHHKRQQWEATMAEMQEYIAKHSQENM